MAEPSVKYTDDVRFEEDLQALSEDIQPLVDLRAKLYKLEEVVHQSGSLILKVEELAMMFADCKSQIKKIDRQCLLLSIRYSKSPAQQELVRRIEKGLDTIKKSTTEMLLTCAELCVEKSITDMMDESFARLVEIHLKNEDIFTRDRYLDVLMKFIQVKTEPQVRESMQLLNVYVNSTIVDRYKTVILKLKRHQHMYNHLKDRFEKYLSNFRFALEMEGAKSIPIRILNYADNPMMTNYSILGAPNQFFEDNKAAVSTSAQFIISKHNTSEFHPMPRDKEDNTEQEFFPVNLSLLKSYATENEIGSFLRVANLLLSQIQMKTNSAIELYSLEEVLSKGLKEFLKLLRIPQVKKLIEEQSSVKNLLIQRLVSLIYSIGNAVQGKLSNDNEISMYNIVSRLFIIQKRLAEAFPDQTDMKRFCNLQIDTFFAFTLKRFVKVIRDKSNYFFELYLKDHLSNFKKLDLFNKELNTLLSLEVEKKLGDEKFYKEYNEVVKNRKFFGENTYKQHYMVPFHFILQRISRNSKGSTIWAVKAATYELFRCLIKKKKFMNFLGYFSLILNLDAFLVEVVKEFPPVFTPLLGSLGELRFLKHFFFKMIYNETQQNSPKKTSSVYVHSKKIKISYDFMGNSEGFTFDQFLATKAEKLELPTCFNSELFYDEITFNDIVS